MSRGIGRHQRKILECVAISGEPRGLPSEVLQAQLWPDLFCEDYRRTKDSARIVREKDKCRVILFRALASLLKRGLLVERPCDLSLLLRAEEVHRRGLKLPYQLRQSAKDDEPNNGYSVGRLYCEPAEISVSGRRGTR
jgi:hypothetical protein